MQQWVKKMKTNALECYKYSSDVNMQEGDSEATYIVIRKSNAFNL